MQSVSLDQTDRKILDLLQTHPGINATAIGERIALSQSACWRRIQRMRDEGVIRDQPVILDREKVGLTTMVFAHVKLTSHGRSNLSTFADDVKRYPEVMDCYVVLGNVDFLLRIVTEDIKAYEQFFFEKLCVFGSEKFVDFLLEPFVGKTELVDEVSIYHYKISCGVCFQLQSRPTFTQPAFTSIDIKVQKRRISYAANAIFTFQYR